MFVFIRRGLFLSLVVAIAACSGPNEGSATPSTALSQTSSAQTTLETVLESAPEVAGGREVIRRLAIGPNAGSPAILINFVSDGPNQSGVPCINCVNGAQSHDNIGMTGPSSYIPTGATWQYTLSFTNISYKGKCKLAWAITSGKKTIDSFAATLNLTSSGGFVLYGVARSRPKYSGAATVTGRATCGKENPSLQAPLQLQ
jgi:hypothetical protein